MTLDWQQIGALVSVLVVLGGIGLFMVRAALAGLFAERKAFEAVEARMTAVEKRLAEGPTGEDMRELYRRMGTVEVSVASATTAITGATAAIGRVEHMMSLLLQNELSKGKPNNEPG